MKLRARSRGWRSGRQNRQSCERCAGEIPGAGYVLCGKCYSAPPDRHHEIEFTEPRDGCCSLCGELYAEAEAHIVCASCICRHPDREHHYWPPDARARIRQCLTCGAVRVMTCLIETKRFHPQTTAIRYRAEFLYYRPGSSQPDSVTSLCVPRRMESPRELCAHDVIEIPTTAERHLVGVTDFVPLISTAVLRSLFDETDLQYTASGSAYYWCTRCGLLYGATQGGDVIVPREGVVKIRAA